MGSVSLEQKPNNEHGRHRSCLYGKRGYGGDGRTWTDGQEIDRNTIELPNGKFNIDHENLPYQKEISLPNVISQGLC